MIVLDTNVVSEPMKHSANARVLHWLDRQVAETLFLTTTSLVELQLGIEILPKGKRRTSPNAALMELLDELFGERILTFDRPAAMRYAPLVGKARAAGRAISMAGAQIASIAAAQGFTVATRDEAPFLATGIAVINPWNALP